MIVEIKSIYKGKCFRGAKCGGYFIHRFFKRKNGHDFVLVQDLQTDKIKSVSKMMIYRAINDNRLMFGYDYFLCRSCKGSGKNWYYNVCARCDGIAIFWLDTGYTYDDIVISYYRRTKKKRIGIDDMLNPKNPRKTAKQAGKKQSKKPAKGILKNKVQRRNISRK